MALSPVVGSDIFAVNCQFATHTVHWAEIRCTVPEAVEDHQLVLRQQ